MKRILIIVGTVAFLAVAAVLSYFGIGASSRNTGSLDGSKLVRAIHAYSQDLRTRGIPASATIPLQELIERGFLKEADVSVFHGMDVQINLQADESRPGDVLVRARLPDGVEVIALADGSVQQRGR